MVTILLRMLRRQWRQGETLLLALAVMLAIFSSYLLAGIGSVLFQGLEASSARLLGADRVLTGSRPAAPEWLQKFDLLQLEHSQQQVFNTMLYRPASGQQPEQMLLVEVTSLDARYPLKGNLLIERGAGEEVQRKPEPGQLWLDLRLKQRLALEVGDWVEIGLAQLQVAGWIKQQPDSAVNPFGAMPNVLMADSDVAATQVIQPGSRVSYRYLLQGDAAALTALDAYFAAVLPEIYRYRGVNSEGFAFSDALSRMDIFLRLSALLVSLLSLAALAISARRFVDRQQRQVALFKALGRSRRWIATVYLSFLSSLLLFATLLGLLLAQLALAGLSQLLQQWLGESLPLTSASAFWLAVLSVWGGALLFLWQPVATLLNISPVALIQGRAATQFSSSYLVKAGMLLLLIGLLQSFSGSWWLTALITVVFVVALGLVFLLSWALLTALQRLPWRSTAIKLALQALLRQVKQNQLLTSGFTLAALLVLAIVFLRHDLLQQFQRQLPADAANQFAINVQPDQVVAFKQFLEQHGMPSSYSYPVVRGRLVKVNQQPVAEREQVTEQARRSSLQRELSLTYRSQLPEGNRLLAGTYLEPSGSVSVEIELAEGLGLEIGDRLTFDVAGSEISASVSSFREVDWNSMRPNFFMITSPDVLNVFPPNYLVSFRVDEKSGEESGTALNQLVKQFPTVTLLDVRQIIDRFSQIIAQATKAMTLVLVLVTLAAGLLLLAQIRVGMDSRMQMLVTMQTLGASLSLLQKMTLFEFALLGALSGLIAAATTELVLAAVFIQLFNLSAEFHPLLWLTGPLFSVLVILSLGWLECRHLLRAGALSRQRLRS